MTPHLRAARSTDAGKLGAMITEDVAAQDWLPRVYTGAQDIAHMGDLIARGWVRVCEIDDTVAGFVAFRAPVIQSLYVAGAVQGRGIGSALLQEKMAFEPRLELWTFEANTGAQRFYQRHGFVPAERTDGSNNDEGLPDIRYVWTRPTKESTNG